MAARGWAAGDLLKLCPRFSPPLAEEAGPRHGWWEGVRGGLPGLAKGAFLPLPTGSPLLPRVLKERAIVSFSGESKGTGVGPERCQSLWLPTWRQSPLRCRRRHCFISPQELGPVLSREPLLSSGG